MIRRKNDEMTCNQNKKILQREIRFAFFRLYIIHIT